MPITAMALHRRKNRPAPIELPPILYENPWRNFAAFLRELPVVVVD